MRVPTAPDSQSATAATNPEVQKVLSYPLFDWLRFALASIVVLGHSGFHFLPFLNEGLAVKTFFALSGWLIGGILLRTQLHELPRFFFNRATRIWIPYALAIVLLYGVAIFKEGIDFFWFKYLLLDITFTHQLYTFFPAARYEMPLDGSGNHFWSIAVEEQFYLLAPLAMIFLPAGKSIRLWLPVATAVVLLDWNAASVSLGVCAAILQRDFGISTRRFVRWTAVAIALATAIIMSFTYNEYVVGPLFAAAIVVLLAIPGRRSSIAVVAGGLSYPLYLNQWIAGFAVAFVAKRWLQIDHVGIVAAIYLTAVLMGLAMYWLVDRQIQLSRNKWYSRSLGRRICIVAYALVAIGLVGGGLMHLYGPHGVAPVPLEENIAPKGLP